MSVPWTITCNNDTLKLKLTTSKLYTRYECTNCGTKLLVPKKEDK